MEEDESYFGGVRKGKGGLAVEGNGNGGKERDTTTTIADDRRGSSTHRH